MVAAQCEGVSGCISIHALREEGDVMGFRSVSNFRISIHALREEGDTKEQVIGDVSFEFLSTPSARRATAIGERQDVKRLISIHALREEGDSFPGEGKDLRRRFLSTPSARRATNRP